MINRNSIANWIVFLQVLPFRLVDDERDCLSLTKRYPRLSVIPDFSKV
jgi:hypothetical protein